jgi:hypothetical protein
MEALRATAPRLWCPQEVAVSEEFPPSPLRIGPSVAEMPFAPQMRNDFVYAVLRATFVALTVGLFILWLATAS